MNKIISIIGAIVLLGSVISGYIYFDSIYARADDLRLTSKRLDQKIIFDKIDRATAQQIDISIACKTSDPLKMQPEARIAYNALQQQINQFNRELSQISNK